MQRRSFLSLLPVAMISATGIRSLLNAKQPTQVGVDIGSGQSWSYIHDLVTAGHDPKMVLRYTPAQVNAYRRAIGAGVN